MEGKESPVLDEIQQRKRGIQRKKKKENKEGMAKSLLLVCGEEEDSGE